MGFIDVAKQSLVLKMNTKTEALALLRLDREIQQALEQVQHLRQLRDDTVVALGFSKDGAYRVRVHSVKCRDCGCSFNHIGSFESEDCSACWDKKNPDKEPSQLMMVDLNCSICGESLTDSVRYSTPHRC